MDKEAELKKAIELKNKGSSEQVDIVRIEDEESSSLLQYLYTSSSQTKETERYHSNKLLLQ